MQKAPTLLVLAALGAAASTLLVRPATAHACSCSRPGVEVAPRAGVAAPLNTVVRVSWWVGESKVDESTFELAPASEASSKRSKKPKKGKKGAEEPAPVSAAIELERTSSTSGKVRTVVLRPKAPLAPSTRYELRVASAAGEKPGVVGEFTTGTATDEKAPDWAGVSKASYVHKPAVCCDCSTGNPYVQLDLAEGGKVSDEGTPATALVYGVWLDDGSKLEPGAAPAKAPLLLARAWSGKLYLGHKSTCSAPNFDLPAGGTTLKLRVAPVDLAGRVGKVSSVSVDVPKAKPAAPAKR